MISIDNAVELMIKTYLGLPKRVTGLTISRKEYQSFAESFPALLDALEEHASEKLVGVSLGEIEWYHRLRNELYHQGNGLTVERDKVEIYSELAGVLFRNLFGVDLVRRGANRAEPIGEFIAAWVELERGMVDTAVRNSLVGNAPRGVAELIRHLRSADLLDAHQAKELNELRHIRNQVVHGGDSETLLTPAALKRVRFYVRWFGSA